MNGVDGLHPVVLTAQQLRSAHTHSFVGCPIAVERLTVRLMPGEYGDGSLVFQLAVKIAHKGAARHVAACHLP